MNSNAHANGLEFGNLPLVEAVVRATLDPPIQMTFNLINSVAKSLHDEFPTLSEPKAIEAAPGRTGVELEWKPGLIIGAVYAGNKQGLAISLQGGVLVSRWLKSAGPDAPGYPRFAALRSALDHAVEALRFACAPTELNVDVVNMSYVNLFVASPPPDIRAYLADSAKVALLAEAREVHKTEVAWQEADGVDVRFDVQGITRQSGNERAQGIRLATTAGMQVDEHSDALATLDLVHARLQEFFLRLISAQAKCEWKLVR